MAENCTHDCSSCSADCSSRDMRVPANTLSRIGKVIAVVSGKGGVARAPSPPAWPPLWPSGAERWPFWTPTSPAPPSPPPSASARRPPAPTRGHRPGRHPPGGIELMSLNLLSAHETDPVIWRGPHHRRGGHPVLAGGGLGGRGLYVRGHAPGQPATCPHRLPVPAGGRGHRDHLPPGPGEHDRHQGGKHGQDDERPRAGPGGELQLLPVPRLRRQARHLRGEPSGPGGRRPGVPVLARLPIDPALAARFDGGQIESLPDNPLASLAEQLDH